MAKTYTVWLRPEITIEIEVEAGKTARAEGEKARDEALARLEHLMKGGGFEYTLPKTFKAKVDNKGKYVSVSRGPVLYGKGKRGDQAPRVEQT